MARGLVLLTGASGFLGGHITSKLLDAGYSVRATLRNETKAKEFLKSFAGKDVHTHIVPDITAEGAYVEAIQGTNFVIHSASPYTFKIKDIQKDLLDPAIQGTVRMLEAIDSCKTIKRLVLTSSFASIIDPFKGPRPDYSYTESDWNPLTAEKALENALFGYQASKKFAEKAAWDFIPSRVAEKGITLVTICPPLIFGPVHPASGITIEAPNESSSQLLQAINNAGEPAPTRMPVFADVRDVAKAHIEALDHDRVPGSERFLVCGGKFTWAAVREIAQTGTNSSDIMEPAAGFYTINAEKAESQLGIKWTTLEVCTRILLLA